LRKFTLRLIAGIVMGVIIGILINQAGGDQHPAFEWVSLLADMFVRLLRMIIVPLVIASIVLAVAELDGQHLRRLGFRTMAYYLLTTLFAAALGLTIVNLIDPGVGALLKPAETPEAILKEQPPTFMNLLRNLIPTNPFDAIARTDMLQIIVFSLIFGIALNLLGERGGTVRRFLQEILNLTMVVVHWVLALLPLGVAFLLARALGQAGWEVISPLLRYMGAVLIGLSVHGLIVLPLLGWFLGRCSPVRFFKGMSRAMLTAFSTSSSSATLPITMECVENELQVPPRVSRFMLPVGATVNMDGTALYEAVAALFIAQVYGIELAFSQQVIVLLTASLAAIGAAGIPSAGLFTMVIVLQSVGLPVEGIGLILAVDRFLDMFRTMVNVEGDAIGTVIMARWEDGRWENGVEGSDRAGLSEPSEQSETQGEEG
jgi:proton glutamate symport protein